MRETLNMVRILTLKGMTPEDIARELSLDLEIVEKLQKSAGLWGYKKSRRDKMKGGDEYK